jgi:AraC-like DNA-binding protein
LFAAQLQLGETAAKHVAQRLGISARTLARRLASEDTSYQRLLDETRRERALRDLSDSPRSIRDIATRLGFASPQSFHRAFRRWTGETAMSYRKKSKMAALAATTRERSSRTVANGNQVVGSKIVRRNRHHARRR